MSSAYKFQKFRAIFETLVKVASGYSLVVLGDVKDLNCLFVIPMPPNSTPLSNLTELSGTYVGLLQF